jgi:hypothetical protein
MANVGPFVCAGFVVALSLAACGDPDEPLDPGPKGCDAAITAEDGATVEGDTRTSEHVTEGSCVTGTAPEVRYRVVPKRTGMLDLKLEASSDLGMYVRKSCEDAASEIGCADLGKEGEPEQLSVPVTEGEPVWIVIDGYEKANAGSFTLALASRPIACGDSKAEGQEECDPPDGGKTCTVDCKLVPEACGDGVDNDLDGFTDCEDSADCGADVAACPIATTCGGAGGLEPNGTAGDTSGGSGDFAGSCTGGSLSPEALFSYSPASAGALKITLESADNLGVYVRASCADAASELGCLDDAAGGTAEVLVVPVDMGAPVTIFVDAAKPADAGAFTVAAALEPSTEVEPNNTTKNASGYGAATFVGAISPSGDEDYVKIDVPAQGATLTATVEDFGNGDCANFKLDSALEVFGPDGKTSLATNDDAGNFCSQVVVKGLAPGAHFVRLAASKNAKIHAFAYRLSLQVK